MRIGGFTINLSTGCWAYKDELLGVSKPDALDRSGEQDPCVAATDVVDPGRRPDIVRGTNQEGVEANHAARTRSKWSGASIDAAALDGRVLLLGRQIAAVAAAGLLAADFGFLVAVGWWALAGIAEFWGWAASRRQAAGDAGTTAGRLNYLLSLAAITATWTAIAVLYWATGDTALQIAGIILVATQLNHAQSFAFRSLPVLLVAAGIPAIALAILPLALGDFGTAQLVTLAFCSVLSFGYIAAGTHANMVAAGRLRTTQDALEKLAYRDALTLLGNRRLFAENLRRLIAFSHRHGTKFALLVIDLDRFKLINDSLGHGVGDALLVEVGARLQRAVCTLDHVARTGGDEFAILLADAHDPVLIEMACQRIAASFVEAFQFDGLSITTSLSFGVAVYPADGDAQDRLLRSADLALYDAKHSGRNTWRYSTRAATYSGPGDPPSRT